MIRRLDEIEKMFLRILKKEKIEMEDIFKYGNKKIEFMFMYPPFVISVSVIDDMSYDFTVFDSTGNIIVYNNSQRGIDVNDLVEFFGNDINRIKNNL